MISQRILILRGWHGVTFIHVVLAIVCHVVHRFQSFTSRVAGISSSQRVRLPRAAAPSEEQLRDTHASISVEAFDSASHKTMAKQDLFQHLRHLCIQWIQSFHKKQS